MRKVVAAEGNMKYIFCWLVAALLTEVHCHQLTDVVSTDKGEVQGIQMKTVMNNVDYSAFLGIPFAKPPVGPLRFRDPVKADRWTGVQNATKDSSECVQFLGATLVGNEDCLYLNVFTPVVNFKKMKKLLPVMIWIYGGKYAGGSISRETNGPDLFIENNVVFVNMNYRLGPLGFLSLNMDESRGNQGLRDQNMAMQWVQKNIAKFGGDPNQVTIFGESAGAVSVIYHLFSPQSKGLFQQVITQSGTPISPFHVNTPNQAIQATYKLGAHMGIKSETNEQLLDALRKADIKDIVKAVHTMIEFTLLRPMILPFNPTIDIISSDHSPRKAYLDDCPISKLQSGNFIRVPIMMGYNKDEIDLSAYDPELLRKELAQRLNKLIASGISAGSRGLTSLLKKVVYGPISDLAKIATAFYLTGPIDSTQQMLAKHNGEIPVYYYRLSHVNKQSGRNGTAHGDDVRLLFCNDSAPHLDPNSEDSVYRQQFVSLWTNFAKYGNPTPRGEPIRGGVWLPSGEEGRQIDLGNEEFKMHDRLLDSASQKFASWYTSILPGVSACAKHPGNPLSALLHKI